MHTLPQPQASQSSRPQDGELQRRIVNYLFAKGLTGLQHLEVEVHGAVAVVRGRVSTYYEKQLVTSCCQRVAGVVQMSNEVEVSE